MKNNTIHHSFIEQVSYIIQSNSYVQIALLILAIIILGNILPACVSYINAVRWGMTV